MARRGKLNKVKKDFFFFFLKRLFKGYRCSKQFIQLMEAHQEKKVDSLLLCNSLQHNSTVTVTSAA